MSRKKEKVFEINDLEVWYNHRKKKALKGIDIDFFKGTTTALIGPSGCGKSTLLSCLNKMSDLIDGVVIKGSIIFDNTTELIEKSKTWKEKLSNTFKNKDGSITPMELRSRVGMVFQKPNPFSMSIYENVAYGPKSSGIRNKSQLDSIVEKSLKNAALWEEVKDNLNDEATGLSGGQQQRLCIARAIAMEPEVLLMDEPTSALDPIATIKIEKLISELKKKFTIIIVTHSMQQAARISDKTAFFYLGELIEYNNTKKIFTSPEKKLTSEYITGKMG